MEDVYEMKYKTGKLSLTVCGIFVIVMLLLALVTLVLSMPALSLVVVVLIFALGCLYITMNGYREIILYHNRMVVTGLFSGEITEIYYANIEHIGFLHGYTRTKGRFLSGGSSVSNDELVILQKGGVSREKFSDDDYDYLHEVCSFIQDKIGDVR